MFVKAIETVPAVALNAVLLYFSWPSAFASRLSGCPAPLAAAFDVLAAAAAELVAGAAAAAAVVAGAPAVEEELLEELPQPARTTSPARSTGRDVRPAIRECAWPVTLEITITSSRVRVGSVRRAAGRA
jgi:hypothetical protein